MGELIILEVYDNLQCKYVKPSEDTSTDNIYRMSKEERALWDKCNKIAEESRKDKE